MATDRLDDDLIRAATRGAGTLATLRADARATIDGATLWRLERYESTRCDFVAALAVLDALAEFDRFCAARPNVDAREINDRWIDEIDATATAAPNATDDLRRARIRGAALSALRDVAARCAAKRRCAQRGKTVYVDANKLARWIGDAIDATPIGQLDCRYNVVWALVRDGAAPRAAQRYAAAEAARIERLRVARNAERAAARRIESSGR